MKYYKWEKNQSTITTHQVKGDLGVKVDDLHPQD
jgi:hypothetical protein